MIAWTAVLRLQAQSRASASDSTASMASGSNSEQMETPLISEPFHMPIRARWSLEDLYDEVPAA
jgi:hypothetical protein